jgi:undecaprenyl pyrophosphate synthase
MIGAIDIDRGRATFEVADSVARQFEQSVRVPDSRDPDLVIRRAGSNRR